MKRDFGASVPRCPRALLGISRRKRSLRSAADSARRASGRLLKTHILFSCRTLPGRAHGGRFPANNRENRHFFPDRGAGGTAIALPGRIKSRDYGLRSSGCTGRDHEKTRHGPSEAPRTFCLSCFSGRLFGMLSLQGGPQRTAAAGNRGAADAGGNSSGAAATRAGTPGQAMAEGEQNRQTLPGQRENVPPPFSPFTAIRRKASHRGTVPLSTGATRRAARCSICTSPRRPTGCFRCTRRSTSPTLRTGRASPSR